MKISDITPKGWLYIGIFILLIILIVLYYKNKNTVTTTVTTTAPSTSTNTNTPSPIGDNFPLRYGSRGNNVKIWQTYLNKLGANLVVDGVWGPKTEAASIQYTKFNSITKEYFDAVTKNS